MKNERMWMLLVESALVLRGKSITFMFINGNEVDIKDIA